MLVLFSAQMTRTARAEMELLGYLENWNNVKWWDNNIPGNCQMGCMVPDSYLKALGPYTSINYGFTFLTEKPNPDQTACKNSTSKCPIWDGKAIYIAAATKQDSKVVTAATTATDLTSGLVGIGEACRLARMAPSGPKRCKVSLGGWSDWARLGSPANAELIAKLVGKLVGYSFADGVDLDFEHLTPYDSQFGGSEFNAFETLVKSIRKELGVVASTWHQTAKERAEALNATYTKLQPWQKKQAFYYPTNIQYMAEIQRNPVPVLELSWTTRFNAFVPENDRFNYLLPSSPVPNVSFATDNEGQRIWQTLSSVVDTVNIMAYDASSEAGPLALNFSAIVRNFIDVGKVPPSKVSLGFEPGNQATGAVWEGLAVDLAAAADAKSLGLAGTFIWALNPDPGTAGAKQAPILAKKLQAATGASWPSRFGPVPSYSHCDPKTGWI